MFSFEYYEIFKNTYFEEHLLTAASDFIYKSYRTAVSSCFYNLLTGYEQLRY